MIELHDVERTFAVGRRRISALRGISLQIPRGAFVLLMGPSGSGKTTLLNLLGGLDRPTAGQVIIDGEDLAGRSEGELAEYRRRIGFIFQSFALLTTASAYENVEMGLRIAAGTPRAEWGVRIRRSLAAVGLTSWADHRPYEMSGGQQQRVAIARALAIRPRLILADEPTGDLDSRTAARVLQLLRSLADHEGCTLVVSSHDPSALDYATEVYRLRDGQIEERGALA
ncbi:MAG TPA: ABC transporter ATP-binding protein [Roseiflexaceae bacterium]|nr:ABC transporter ATP-binding protein [Roseiflexaceae bacterium]